MICTEYDFSSSELCQYTVCVLVSCDTASRLRNNDYQLSRNRQRMSTVTATVHIIHPSFRNAQHGLQCADDESAFGKDRINEQYVEQRDTNCEVGVKITTTGSVVYTCAPRRGQKETATKGVEKRTQTTLIASLACTLRGGVQLWWTKRGQTKPLVGASEGLVWKTFDEYATPAEFEPTVPFRGDISQAMQEAGMSREKLRDMRAGGEKGHLKKANALVAPPEVRRLRNAAVRSLICDCVAWRVQYRHPFSCK